MDSNPKQQHASEQSSPVEPSRREHGLDGYTEGAVSGFGESYQFQVAHGGAGDSPGTPSDSELDAADGAANDEPIALEQAVRKALGRAHIDAADLSVEVVESTVRLRGTVRHSFEKAELEARARAVPGVSSLVSELAVLRGDWQENA